MANEIQRRKAMCAVWYFSQFSVIPTKQGKKVRHTRLPWRILVIHRGLENAICYYSLHFRLWKIIKTDKCPLIGGWARDCG